VTKILLHTVETERMNPDAYRAPTPEELEAYKLTLEASKKARKAAAPSPIPLINPTDEDAERLQALWNRRVEERQAAKPYSMKPEAQTVLCMTQEEYAERSKGSYARCETEFLVEGGAEYYRSIYGKDNGKQVCKIRKTYGEGSYTGNAHRVIVLTDKPQKPLPAAVWPAPKFALEMEVAQ
jgi:hypothetical protein